MIPRPPKLRSKFEKAMAKARKLKPRAGAGFTLGMVLAGPEPVAVAAPSPARDRRHELNDMGFTPIRA